MTPDREGGDSVKLVAYVRVSTIEQAEHGYGLDMQRAAIRSAAKRLGATIVDTKSDEGVSGALDANARPGLTDALAMIRSGEADGLIVRDLDRLARAVFVQEAILTEVWSNEGAGVYTSAPPAEVLRDDPDDPMRTAMRQMAGVFIELDRRLIVKRLRDGRRTKAAKGGYAHGALPYGYRSVKGKLVAVPTEQHALALMKRLAVEGKSTRNIAAALIEGSHPTKRGGTWTHATVARILKRHNTTERATA